MILFYNSSIFKRCHAVSHFFMFFLWCSWQCCASYEGNVHYTFVQYSLKWSRNLHETKCSEIFISLFRKILPYFTKFRAISCRKMTGRRFFNTKNKKYLFELNFINFCIKMPYDYVSSPLKVASSSSKRQNK
jgi:hypothetical protein